MKRLSFLALTGLLFASCQERDSSPSAPEAGIPVGARLVATAPLPVAEQVRLRLTVDGVAKAPVFSTYQSGKEIDLGRAPRNARLAFDLRAFSLLGSDTVWKWFASSSGTADSVDHWTFPLAVIHAVASSGTANVPTSLEPGQVWKIPAGTWYTVDGSDPRTSSSRLVARSGEPADSVVLAAGLVVRAQLRTGVDDRDTLMGDLLRLEVAAVVVSTPGFSLDTNQIVARGTEVTIHRKDARDTVEYRRNGVGAWILDSTFAVDTGHVVARSRRAGVLSAEIRGAWALQEDVPLPALAGSDSVDAGGLVQLVVPKGYLVVYSLGDSTHPQGWPASGLVAPDTSFLFWARLIPLAGGRNSPWTGFRIKIRPAGSVRAYPVRRSTNTDTLWVRLETDSGNGLRILRPDALESEVWTSGDSLPVLVDKILKAWARRGTLSGDTLRFAVSPVAPPPPDASPKGGALRSDETVTLTPSIPGDQIYYRVAEGGWSRYIDPFQLPVGSNVRVEVSESHNRLEGLDTLHFDVREPAGPVAVGGCKLDCDPGSRLTLSVGRGSVQWRSTGGTWSPYDGATGIVLDSTRTWSFRSISPSGLDTSAAESLTVRVLQPNRPAVTIVSLTGSTASIRLGPTQTGDTVAYRQGGSTTRIGQETTITANVGDTLVAWATRGTASTDTTRLAVTSFLAPFPDHQAGTYPPNTVLQFTLPTGGSASDEIELSTDRGASWDVRNQVALAAGTQEIWARTRRPVSGGYTYSDTVTGVWIVASLVAPRLVVPASRALALGDSGVRLAQADANATFTEVRVGSGPWTVSGVGSILGASRFSVTDRWLRVEARSVRQSGALWDTSASAVDSVVVRDMRAPGVKPDSGTYHVDSVRVTALQGACASCIPQRYDAVGGKWVDLGSGFLLSSPGSQVVRVRLVDSTRTLNSAPTVVSYLLYDLPAMANLAVTPLDGVTRLSVSPSATPFLFEVLEQGAWKSVAAGTGYLVQTSGTVVYRFGYQSVRFIGSMAVTVRSLRVDLKLDPSSWKVSLSAPSGFVPEYSVDGGDPTASVWTRDGGFLLCATGHVWLRACDLAGSLCTTPIDTVLVRSDNSGVRAGAGSYFGLWIDPLGKLRAANATVPKDLESKQLTGIWVDETGGVARTSEGAILPWGELATFAGSTSAPLDAFLWSKMKDATDFAIQGTRGIARVGDFWYPFGSETSAGKLYSDLIDPDLLGKASLVAVGTGDIDKSVNLVGGKVPYTVLAIGNPGSEQTLLACVDGNWKNCYKFGAYADGDLQRIEVRGNIIVATSTRGASNVYQAKLESNLLSGGESFGSINLVNELKSPVAPVVTTEYLVYGTAPEVLYYQAFSSASGTQLAYGGDWELLHGGSASVVALAPDGRFNHFYLSSGTSSWLRSTLSVWMAAPYKQ